MGRLFPTGLHELLQRQAVGRQRTRQQSHGFARREPIRLEARQPRPFDLARTQVTQRQGGQAVTQWRIGQQGVI